MKEIPEEEPVIQSSPVEVNVIELVNQGHSDDSIKMILANFAKELEYHHRPEKEEHVHHIDQHVESDIELIWRRSTMVINIVMVLGVMTIVWYLRKMTNQQAKTK